MEEVDDISLRKSHIPMIVDAVLSNFSMEGTSSKDDSQDNLYLDEYLTESYVHCYRNALLVTMITTVVVQYE